MSEKRGPTREQIADLVLTARTWEECLAAEQALRDWMRQHPDDFGMLAGGEQLTLVKEALQEERQASRKVAAT